VINVHLVKPFLCEYFFMAFRVSIGFSNERSGAVLVLLKGESL
jgi:hypothetical protein